MITYENLYHLNLRPLESAAEAWQQRGRKLAEAAADFEQEVLKQVRQSGWEQDTSTEETAKSRLTQEHKELEEAAKLAKAVRGNLDEAVRELGAKKKELVDLVETELPKKFFMNGQGQVQLSESVLPPDSGPPLPLPVDDAEADQRAKDLQEARLWQQRINKVLQDATGIDENAVSRLRWNFTDGDDGSQFRTDTMAGGKADASADAVRATELARKGEDMSLSEIKEFNGLMKEHGNDPAFASKFAKQMGGQGTLDFWAQMKPEFSNPNDPRNVALQQTGKQLGETLGTATSSGDPGMRKWQEEVIAAGDQRQGEGRDYFDPYGFQVTSDLVQHGEWDADFLNPYGKELLTFERQQIEDGKSPQELWTNRSDSPTDQSPGNTWGNDPVVGLLEGVSHSPEAATELFNDKSIFKDTSAYVDQGMVNMPWMDDEKGSYSTADYLMRHREFYNDTDMVNGQRTNPSMDALGDAMLAAGTGRDPDVQPPAPYTEPTPEQLEATRNTLHAAAENDDFPPELRQDMGKLIAHHGESTYQTMSNPASMPTPFDHAELAKVSAEVSQDPKAYGTLQDSMSNMASHDINTEKDNPQDSLDRVGRMNGFMEHVEQSVVNDIQSDGEKTADWYKAAAGSAVSGGLGYIPIAGGVASAAAGGIADGINMSYKDGLENEANVDRAKIDDAYNNKMTQYVEAWQATNGNWAESQGKSANQIHNEINDAALSGRKDAEQAAGGDYK